MKQFFIAAIAVLSTLVITAQSSLPVKLVEITAVKYSGGYADNILGKEINAFQVPDNANSIKMAVQIPVKEYKKYASKMLHLVVTNTATGEGILSTYWDRLYKDTVLTSQCYFPSGDYSIRLLESNDTNTVYANRMITVKPGKANPAAQSVKINGYTYDVSKFKIWTCQSVDETAWKPVGQTSRIKVGGCITFFFDSPDKIKSPGTMRWKLYKVEADGKETFINQRDQNSRFEEYRRMYYEECDEFRTPGTYRIYYAVKNESEAYYGVRDTDFFAKADVIVE